MRPDEVLERRSAQASFAGTRQRTSPADPAHKHTNRKGNDVRTPDDDDGCPVGMETAQSPHGFVVPKLRSEASWRNVMAESPTRGERNSSCSPPESG
eukprot:2465950-Rhodomonas_salina.1